MRSRDSIAETLKPQGMNIKYSEISVKSDKPDILIFEFLIVHKSSITGYINYFYMRSRDSIAETLKPQGMNIKYSEISVKSDKPDILILL